MNRFLTASLVIMGMGMSPALAAPVDDGPILAIPTSKSASDCPSGKVCLFRDANYTGPFYYFSVGSANFTQLPCAACTNGVHGNDGTFNNQMTSWINRSSSRFCWYVRTQYGGTPRVMNTGTSNPNVGAANNDLASSLRKC
ncbi:MAG TPA: peptidase inhibitor family I36 protein [Stenomitos sp.]